MPLYPLGICRRRDVPSVPRQAAASIHMRWSFAGELACAFIDAPHQAVPPKLHATVLDAIHRRICVLPVRFGVALHDATEIRSMLDSRHDELLDHLKKESISAVFHYIPLHSSPMGRKFGYTENDLPITNDVSGRLLRLPLYYDITEEEQTRVIEGIGSYLGAASRD